MEELPVFSIGYNELPELEKIGEEILCKRCGQYHDIKYGEVILEDGTRKKDKGLAFVNCGDSTYLVGVKGKRLEGGVC